jgi:hypothetical protein
MPLGFTSLHTSSQWLTVRLVAATHRNLLENTIVTSPIMLTPLPAIVKAQQGL